MHHNANENMSRGGISARGQRGNYISQQSPRGNRAFNGRGPGRGNYVHNYHKPTIHDSQVWKTWSEVRVRVKGLPHGLPHEMFTVDVHDALKQYGNIVAIDILEAKSDNLPRMAWVTFNPPPREPFWQRERIEIPNMPGWLQAELQDSAELAQKRSKPVGQIYENRVTCLFGRLDFGFEYEPNHIAIKRSLPSLSSESMSFVVNTDRCEIVIFFSIDHRFLEEDADFPTQEFNDQASNSSSESADGTVHEFKFNIPFKQLQHVGVRYLSSRFVELFISLPTSNVPRFYKKMDPSTTFEERETYWNVNRAWLRRTTICSNAYGKHQRHTPMSLNEPEPFIDIASLTTYRLCIDRRSFTSSGAQALQALERFHINYVDDYNPQVTYLANNSDISAAPFWTALDHDHNPMIGHAIALANLSNNTELPWTVRYQLEVCISKDLLNPYNLSKEFITALAAKPEGRAIKLLEHVADRGKRIFNPMQIFNLRPPKTSSASRIHANHVAQRSITVKPSSMEYMTPSVDESNRIIRRFNKLSDRFIRVNFRDEKGEGKIFSDDSEVNLALFNRVMRALNYGIRIGNRHFVWLASGNSQFREHGAYFFAPIPGVIDARSIREEMGNFSEMHYVAKLNARMGQCFSTTREFNFNPKIVQIEDVETTTPESTICFTDGVGKTSDFVKKLINEQMKFPQHTVAFQFRMGGVKGVIASWPDVKIMEVVTRPSQTKFSAQRSRLEIIRPAVFVRPELNRQLITLFTCLGVEENVFMRKLNKMLADIDEAMRDPEKARRLLRKRVDVNSMTLTIKSMVKAGFMESDDPFVRSLLLLWRAWSHKKLKEKAGIQIDKGAFLMGVTDETQTLKGHHNTPRPARPRSTEDVLASLPEVFVQVSDQKDPNELRVIKGVCVIARNPSLHPGDLRIVKAVDIPGLHHLNNVLVFAQKGDVDVPSMCSGGDLDGDDFFISWDQELIPPLGEWNHAPMKHTPAVPEWKSTISEDDVKVFFVNHMKSDFLGKIANAWLAQADQLENGPKDSVCKRLADLHSTAVDFPKNGVPASGKVFKKLIPKRYPHFLESNRPAFKVYHSSSIVGKLYDTVERIEYQPLFHLPFDRRVLDFHKRDLDLEDKVQVLKNEYDMAIRRIMAQFEVENEGEIWTGFVMQHGKGLKEYELQSKIGSVVNAQKEKFREVCINEAGGRGSHQIARFVAAMYWITARQVSSELQDLTETYGYQSPANVQMAPAERPMMSFPWLFDHELGQIAKGRVNKISITLPQADIPKTSDAADLPLINLHADDQSGSADYHIGEGVKHADQQGESPWPVASFLDSSNSPSVFTEDQYPKVAQPFDNLHATSLLDSSTKEPLHQLVDQASPLDENNNNPSGNNSDAEAKLQKDFAALDFHITSSEGSIINHSSPGTTDVMANVNDASDGQNRQNPPTLEGESHSNVVTSKEFIKASDHRQTTIRTPSAVVDAGLTTSATQEGNVSQALRLALDDETTELSDEDEEDVIDITSYQTPFSRLANMMKDGDDFSSQESNDDEQISNL